MPPKPLILDGLTADVPRAARFTARVQASRLLLLLAPVLVVGLFCLWAASDLRDLNALRAHGQTTMAQITGRHTARGSKTVTYYVDYTFHADGTQVDDEYEVGRAEYERPQSSATMLVTFLPPHPRTNRRGAVTFERILYEWLRWIMEGCGVSLLLGGLLAVREFYLRQRLTLLRDGSVAGGVVSGASGTKSGFHVIYGFKAGGWFSPEITGSHTFPEPIPPGQTLTILYDPARVSRNIPCMMLTDVVLAPPRH